MALVQQRGNTLTPPPARFGGRGLVNPLGCYENLIEFGPPIRSFWSMAKRGARRGESAFFSNITTDPSQERDGKRYERLDFRDFLER